MFLIIDFDEVLDKINKKLEKFHFLFLKILQLSSDRTEGTVE
jgi:hypothetical protein